MKKKQIKTNKLINGWTKLQCRCDMGLVCKGRQVLYNFNIVYST